MNRFASHIAFAFCVVGMLAGSIEPARAQARTGLEGVYEERAALVMANKSCGFLGPGAALSAEAGRLQTRGTLLRNGTTDATLTKIDAEVRSRVNRLACTSPRLVQAAKAAREAHAAWLQLGDTAMPAYQRSWRIRRIATDPWRADQMVGTGAKPVRIGLIEASGGYAMAIGVANPVTAVRFIVRDPRKAGRPFAPAGRPAVPPRAVTQTFFPAQQSREPFSPYSKPAPPPSTLFVLPIAARDALSVLDPRELFQVEVVSAAPDGREATQVYTGEVGDFGAAFLLLSAR